MKLDCTAFGPASFWHYWIMLVRFSDQPSACHIWELQDLSISNTDISLKSHGTKWACVEIMWAFLFLWKQGLADGNLLRPIVYLQLFCSYGISHKSTFIWVVSFFYSCIFFAMKGWMHEDLSSLHLSDLQLCSSRNLSPVWSMDSEPKNSSFLMHPEPLHGFH